MLKLSPTERLSAEEILKHPWLQDTVIVRKAEVLMDTPRRSRLLRHQRDGYANGLAETPCLSLDGTLSWLQMSWTSRPFPKALQRLPMYAESLILAPLLIFLLF